MKKAMKQIFSALMMLAMVFVAVSCQNDDFAQGQATRPMTINAVAEAVGTGTRADLVYKYDVVWRTGDQILVKGDGKSATFNLTGGEGTTEGTFACQDSPFTSGTDVEAFYPKEVVDGENLVWPTKQEGTTVPMYSKGKVYESTAEKFAFKSLGSVLQIVFNSEQADIKLKSITITDDEKTLSGKFTVNTDGQAVISATDKAGITLDFGETGKALGRGANFFNIAVPSGAYSKLNIVFTDIKGATCTMKGSATLGYNKVARLVLTGSGFIPAGSRGSAEVNTEAGIEGNKVNWVQLWEGGPKFAEYNVGVTHGKAESFGGYYTWGGSYKNGDGIEWIDDHNESPIALKGNKDTATKLWGKKWRMPAFEDFAGLFTNCTTEYIKDPNDPERLLGIKITGKGAYAANSIFLPAAGYISGGDYSEDPVGVYWSSTPYEYADEYGFEIFFYEGMTDYDIDYRGYAYSVRAVLNEIPTTGTAEATIGGEQVDVNWVQLWEDGPKFAEYNVGVTDGKTTSYGGYYAWGGSQTMVDDHNTGTADLTGDSDTATKLWGNNWRMPTKDEFVALKNNCTCTWTEDYNGTGINGLLCKGKAGTAYENNCIFLPAAGYALNKIWNANELGAYWSSFASTNVSIATYMTFESALSLTLTTTTRSSLSSVRAVLRDFTDSYVTTEELTESDFNWKE